MPCEGWRRVREEKGVVVMGEKEEEWKLRSFSSKAMLSQGGTFPCHTGIRDRHTCLVW